MKRTPLKQVGKIGRINAKANKKIAELWIEHDIERCEVCPVLHEMGLLDWSCLQASSNAHRHSRHDYRSCPEKLWSFNQVVRACIKAHTYIDQTNPSIKEEVFLILRGEDDITTRSH